MLEIARVKRLVSTGLLPRLLDSRRVVSASDDWTVQVWQIP